MVRNINYNSEKYDSKIKNTFSAENAIKNKNLRDALEFGPFLIVNGKPLEIVGDPWGRAPRIAKLNFTLGKVFLFFLKCYDIIIMVIL